MAAAVVPVVVATARGVADGWYPVGDNAFFSLRARDVLTEHHPLLGTWTSASLSIGTDVNNPGPLLFDLFAIPARIAPASGVAVAAALLNLAAIALIAVFAARQGGSRLLAASMAMVAVLSWAMGSELLYDPWQPHSLLLPFLAFLTLVWSLAGGDVVALPWAVGVASLLVQTHLSYGVIVPALGLGGAVGLVVRMRRAPHASWRGVVLVALVVLVVAWAQPLAEQVAGDGPGNLGELATNAGAAAETVGPSTAARYAAPVLAGPQWLTRGGFADLFRPSPIQDGPAGELPDVEGEATARAAGLGFAALAAVLLALGWAAHRRRDGAGGAAVAVSVGATVLALLTIAALPVHEVLGVGPHQLRFLWAIAAFTAFGAVTVLTARVPRAATVVLALVAVVLGVANLPTHHADAGPNADAEAAAVIAELAPQLAALEGRGTLQFDVRGLRFAEPYSTPVMLELQRRGIEFVVVDDGLVHQLGPSRRDEGEARERIFVREGEAALTTEPGAERVALARTLDERGRADLLRLTSRVGRALRESGVELTSRGEQARAAGELGTLDIDRLLATGELVTMVETGWIAPPAGLADDLARYARLQRRFDRETVAVFLAPVDGDAG